MSPAALKVMDLQEAILQRFGEPPGYLRRLNVAISAAREARIPVVCVSSARAAKSASRPGRAS